MNRRRVVVTGMGVVSPLGCELNVFWDRLVNGRSGVRRMQRLDPTNYTSQIAGEVVEFDVDAFIPKKEQRRMDPFCRYGIAAAKKAVTHAGADFSKLNPERCGVLIGSGIGGLQICIEQVNVLRDKGPSRFSPFMIPQMITDIVSGYVAIEYGLQGPNFCITSACATATHSIGESFRMIQHDEADMMIAGGTEAPICELGVGGFCAMRALSTRNDEPEKASRPFDRDRDGFVIGEGAGILVLEEYEHARRRGANILCELAGYGRTCDAYHITAPHEDGRGAQRAMELAMRDAGVGPDGIDYINPHATSTNLGDKGETKAIKQALGARAKDVPVSATKSLIGHTLGAAGGIESIASILMLQHGVIHPTINCENQDPECDLDCTKDTARNLKIRALLKNNFGFGGHNACLCYKAIA